MYLTLTLIDFTNPYDPAPQKSFKLEVSGGGYVKGFKSRSIYVDEVGGKFIISGQYAIDSIYYYAFITVVPGQEPLYKTMRLDWSSQSDFRKSRVSFANSKVS